VKRTRSSERPRKTRRRRPPNATTAAAARILDTLEAAHPEAECALHHKNPFELLAATILSAQCTDRRVNEVTPALFARCPTASDLAAARTPTLESLIRSTGFFRAKAKSLIGCAKALAKDHGGMVPKSLEVLVKLPGIGRKTANVVLGHAYGMNEGIAVDTHVLRVTNRLGLVKSDDPIKVEAKLMTLIPRERWTRTTDLVIFHGRKICDARRPACGACPLFGLCRWKSRHAWALGTPRRPRATAPRPTARAKARRRPARARRSA
jgi:endonuclease-3